MGVMDQDTEHTHSLPSMPFSRLCHMEARHLRAAPACVGGEHNGSCLDTSQMLTRACSLSLPWLAEDKGEKDNEKKFIELVGSFYSLDLNQCLMHMFSQVFSFFLFICPTRLGNSISQQFLPILIRQIRFSNYIS